MYLCLRFYFYLEKKHQHHLQTRLSLKLNLKRKEHSYSEGACVAFFFCALHDDIKSVLINIAFIEMTLGSDIFGIVTPTNA